MVDQIPPDVRAYLEAMAAERSPAAELAKSQAAVSERYRRVEPAGAGGFGIRSEAEALAYAVARLPATYAVNASVLGRIHDLDPEFSPQSVLDVGAGPATSTLAATRLWQPVRACLVEPNRFLSDLGREVVGRFTDVDAAWHMDEVSRFISGKLETDAHDLVILSYMMNEIEPRARRAIIERLWAACAGILVVIETGTPLGFSVIADVRRQAAELGAHLIGPCPQAGECPLAGDAARWCHFSVRAERSRAQKALKDGASLGYEDEKFSWAALSRRPAAVPDFRIIGHPSGTKLRELQVCTKAGEAVTLPVPKSSPFYKSVRKLEWGDGFSNV